MITNQQFKDWAERSHRLLTELEALDQEINDALNALRHNPLPGPNRRLLVEIDGAIWGLERTVIARTYWKAVVVGETPEKPRRTPRKRLKK